ncbi:MAG: RT0821/Lpp0805 family surface protein [Alphaproteobacteria bacterium]
MKNFGLVMMCLAMLSLGACETMQNRGQKETLGGLGGAVLGGIAGSQVGGGSGRLWATGAGVLLGGLLGSEIGSSLDKADKMYAAQANTRAHEAPIGETITWNNPESGNYGEVTPTRDGYSAAGRYCREYQQTIVVNGQNQTGYGQACQQPDGSWEIVT